MWVFKLHAKLARALLPKKKAPRLYGDYRMIVSHVFAKFLVAILFLATAVSISSQDYVFTVIFLVEFALAVSVERQLRP